MKPEKIRELRELVVIAIFSDDELMERMVLKGGNALDLIYKLSNRASFDLDFSMSDQFEKSDLPRIEAKLKKTVERVFLQAGYQIFDFNFSERPHIIAPEVKDFWGGYAVDFKFIEEAKFKQYEKNIDDLRRNAVSIGKKGSTKVEIDISKFEICDQKSEQELRSLTIYVYTPEMVAFEKVRALCQQTDSYKQILKTFSPKPRAKDFYDIHLVMNHYQIDPRSQNNLELIRRIFDAKKVRFSIAELEAKKEMHRPDFASLPPTLSPEAAKNLLSFDEYFAYLIDTFGHLETLWNE